MASATTGQVHVILSRCPIVRRGNRCVVAPPSRHASQPAADGAPLWRPVVAGWEKLRLFPSNSQIFLTPADDDAVIAIVHHDRAQLTTSSSALERSSLHPDQIFSSSRI